MKAVIFTINDHTVAIEKTNAGMGGGVFYKSFCSCGQALFSEELYSSDPHEEYKSFLPKFQKKVRENGFMTSSVFTADALWALTLVHVGYSDENEAEDKLIAFTARKEWNDEDRWVATQAEMALIDDDKEAIALLNKTLKNWAEELDSTVDNINNAATRLRIHDGIRNLVDFDAAWHNFKA